MRPLAQGSDLLEHPLPVVSRARHSIAAKALTPPMLVLSLEAVAALHALATAARLPTAARGGGSGAGAGGLKTHSLLSRQRWRQVSLLQAFWRGHLTRAARRPKHAPLPTAAGLTLGMEHVQLHCAVREVRQADSDAAELLLGRGQEFCLELHAMELAASAERDEQARAMWQPLPLPAYPETTTHPLSLLLDLKHGGRARAELREALATKQLHRGALMLELLVAPEGHAQAEVDLKAQEAAQEAARAAARRAEASEIVANQRAAAVTAARSLSGSTPVKSTRAADGVVAAAAAAGDAATAADAVPGGQRSSRRGRQTLASSTPAVVGGAAYGEGAGGEGDDDGYQLRRGELPSAFDAVDGDGSFTSRRRAARRRATSAFGGAEDAEAGGSRRHYGYEDEDEDEEYEEGDDRTARGRAQRALEAQITRLALGRIPLLSLTPNDDATAVTSTWVPLTTADGAVMLEVRGTTLMTPTASPPTMRDCIAALDGA